jgi:hypothetical protein
MWGDTDMGGSGADREVTRGTTEATLWTSSQWELSQDLGKLTETSPTDADTALKPGEIYQEPKDTHETTENGSKLIQLSINPEVDTPMWGDTDMGGSGLSREVTKGTTEATLRTSSQRELSQDLGKLHAALNPGENYRDPNDTHETPTTTKEMAEPMAKPEKERAKPTTRTADTPAPTKETAERETGPKETPASTKEKEKQRPDEPNKSNRLNWRTKVDTPELYRKNPERSKTNQRPKWQNRDKKSTKTETLNTPKDENDKAWTSMKKKTNRLLLDQQETIQHPAQRTKADSASVHTKGEDQRTRWNSKSHIEQTQPENESRYPRTLQEDNPQGITEVDTRGKTTARKRRQLRKDSSRSAHRSNTYTIQGTPSSGKQQRQHRQRKGQNQRQDPRRHRPPTQRLHDQLATQGNSDSNDGVCSINSNDYAHSPLPPPTKRRDRHMERHVGKNEHDTSKSLHEIRDQTPIR